MDNTTITHNAVLGFEGFKVQTTVSTGRILLDLGCAHGITEPIHLSESDAEDLAAIILAALNDKER